MQLQHLTRVVSDGQHNAFTSLVRWRDRYWLAYRAGNSHSPAVPGQIVIRTSADGRDWTAQTTLHTGGDDRDPRFFVSPDDELYVYWGTYVPFQCLTVPTMPSNGAVLVSHLAQYMPGRGAWTRPMAFGRVNYWVWSIVAMPDRPGKQDAGLWLAAAYHTGGPGDTTSTALFACTDATRNKALVTGYPVWRYYTPLTGTCMDLHSEPVLWQAGDHEVAGLVRQDDGVTLLGHGTAPYLAESWAWEPLPYHLHVGAVLDVAGKTLVAGRLPEHEWRSEKPPSKHTHGSTSDRLTHCTVLCWLDPDTDILTPALRLPSGGDTGYPGLAPGLADDTVLVSYYAQHEYPDTPSGWEQLLQPTPADVYVAEVLVA